MSLLKQSREAIRADWPAYGVICLAFVMQAVLITQPLDFLITNLLPDDAFYYFEIARNITLGLGSTFDGINLTNGYHPLWMLMILPLFAIFSAGGTLDTLPIYLSLGMSVVLNVGTALILLRILTHITKSPLIRASALALCLLNPFMFFETVNGLETSVALLLLSAFMLAALRAQERETKAAYILVTVVAGLMILARMDLAFYFAAYLVWLLVTLGFKSSIRQVLLMGVGATLICLPWFIWNYATFQMIFTSASNANTLINHVLVAQDNGPGLWVQIKGALYLLVYHGKEALLRTGAPWLLFALLGAAAGFMARKEWMIASLRRNLPLLLALFGGFVVLFFVNAGIRFTGRAWYFISFNIFVMLAAAWTLDAVLSKKQRLVAVVVLSLLVSGTFVLGWKTTLKDQFINQRAMFSMAGWMNENLPHTANVGVFNAGVQGYFAHATVINLDALVNNAAYEAMKEHKLWSYIEDENIEYISDFPLYLTYRYKSFLDIKDVFSELEPVYAIPVEGDARNVGGLTLYQVKSSEE